MGAGKHPDFRRVRSPFEGRLIRLRPIEEDDIRTVNEMVWDPEVSRHLVIAWPESLAGTRAFWDRVRAHPETPTFAIETLAGELIGLCGLDEVDARSRSGSLGIWIGKPYWNQGYGTDAVRTLCRFAFREMRLQRMGLHVYETNPRARRAYQKVGFVEEGRLRRAHFVGGRHVDVIVMGLLVEELTQD
jgi:RimJ/RimL family protein N-acetyltransferase